MLGFELLSNGSLHVVAFFTTLLSANRPTPLIRFGIQSWILFHMIAVDNGWGGEDISTSLLFTLPTCPHLFLFLFLRDFL